MNLALLVGIFPYILKLLTGQGSDDSKHILVSIWASIIGFDISCRDQLVKEKSQTHFIQFLSSADMSIQHRTMAAFVLAEICNEYRYKVVSSFYLRGDLCIWTHVLHFMLSRDGQQTCLEMGLHRVCTSTIALLQQQPMHQSKEDRLLYSTSGQLNHGSISMLKIWVCLCLSKLCDGYPWAKYLCITEAGHTQVRGLYFKTKHV